MVLSDKKILQLWRHEGKTPADFFGSYQGALTLQRSIMEHFNEKVPLPRLYKILGQDMDYLTKIRPNRRFERRSYSSVMAVGQIWQV